MKITAVEAQESVVFATITINNNNAEYRLEIDKEFWVRNKLKNGSTVDFGTTLWDEFVGAIRSTTYPNRIGPRGSVGHVNVSGEEALNSPDLAEIRDTNLFTRKERESMEYVLNNN